MGKLVIAGKRHLERESERLDEHDRNGAGGGADGEVDERILLAVSWRNLVDHEDGEDGDKGAVE